MFADDDSTRPSELTICANASSWLSCRLPWLERAVDVVEPGAEAVVDRAVERVVEVEREQAARRHDDERGADARERDEPDPQ